MRNSVAVLAMIPICMMEYMTTQDFAIVNGALGSVAGQFHVPVTELHWVISAQLLSVGAFMVPGGIAGDRFGRKTVFVTGLILTAICNLFMFFAPTFTAFIGARALNGVAMAFLVPVALAMIADLMPALFRRSR
jgi:MFS family permease